MKPTEIDGIAYLTYSGSIAYGTNTETSDVDIRGFYQESIGDIITSKSKDTITFSSEDTVVYSLRKFIHLCKNANPNVLELLGTKDEHVIFMNDVGKMIRDNRELFFSKKICNAFGGYATAQLRRLQNALAHDAYDEEEKREHILKSIRQMIQTNEEVYSLNGGQFNIYIDGDEIKLDVSAKGLPLRKFNAVSSDVTNMLKNYDKLNHRNRKKDDAHLYKHAMHLIRLYLTGIDLLEGRGLHTYRENDLDLLMSIRNGEVAMEKILKMADEFESKLNCAYDESKLPEKPDDAAIDKLLLKAYGLRS